jgi:hypothetical protein
MVYNPHSSLGKWKNKWRRNGEHDGKMWENQENLGAFG